MYIQSSLYSSNGITFSMYDANTVYGPGNIYLSIHVRWNLKEKETGPDKML